MKNIIRILHKEFGAMSANELSEKTGISYATIRKYLKELKKKKIIKLLKRNRLKKKYSGRSETKRYSIDYKFLKYKANEE